MQRVGNILDRRPASGEFLLDRTADALDKIFVLVRRPEFFFKLRGEHRQQFGVAGDKWTAGVGGAKDDRIVRSSADHGAAEVPRNRPGVPPLLDKLHALRRETCPRAMASDREYPGEGTFDQDRRLLLVRQQPVKLDAPLLPFPLLQDLLRAGELLVPGHPVDARAEALARQRRETDRMKAFGLVFRAQLQADCVVWADFADRPPKSKIFFRPQEHSRLLPEKLRKPGPPQNRRRGKP